MNDAQIRKEIQMEQVMMDEIEKVIMGENSLVEDENSKAETRLPKLYKAYSELPEQEKFVHWFCSRRMKPVAPYHVIIDRYEELAPKAKEEAECYVDQLLTIEELKSMTGMLLKAPGELLIVKEFKIPVPTKEMAICEYSDAWKLYKESMWELDEETFVAGVYNPDEKLNLLGEDTMRQACYLS